jgi:hypothetical protein
MIESFGKTVAWMTALAVVWLLVRLWARRHGADQQPETFCSDGLGCGGICRADLERHCPKQRPADPTAEKIESHQPGN